MFGIGFWEIVFCSIIGLLILGPEKLAHVLRDLSKLVKSIRNTASKLSEELSQEIDDMRDLDDSKIKNNIKN